MISDHYFAGNAEQVQSASKKNYLSGRMSQKKCLVSYVDIHKFIIIQHKSLSLKYRAVHKSLETTGNTSMELH